MVVAAQTVLYDKTICNHTWEALETFHKQVVGFREEQQLIDAVHTEEDTNLLTHYEENEHLILEGIFESLRENEHGNAPELIRDVLQVQVIIHNEPNSAITKDPWQWENFSLRPTTFMKKGRWDWMREQTQERGWACKQLLPKQEQVEQELSDGVDGLDNRQQLQTSYTWDPVQNPAEIRKALLIALPSEVATYDPALGFLFRDDFPDYVPEHIYQSRYIKRGFSQSIYPFARH